MRVLLLTDSYPSDDNLYAGVFIHKQAKALMKKSVNIMVLHLDLRSIRKKRTLGFYKKVFDGVTVYTCSVPCGPVPAVIDFLYKSLSLFCIKKIISEVGHIDLLHAHFTNMGMCCAAIKQKYKIPVVLTEHSSALIKGKMSFNEKRNCKKIYQAMDCLIAVGTNLRTAMQKYTDKAIKVIPNVLSEQFHICDTHKNEAFTFIAVVGNITQEKRLHILIEAFSEVFKEFSDIRLIILGEGYLLDDLKRQVTCLDITEFVSFLGIIDNDCLPELYNKCHCFVLPSIYETFGVVYIEAAACGLPLIGCNSGGTYDFITPSNGIIVEKDDLIQLEDAMRFIRCHYFNYNLQEISKDIINKFGEDTVAANIIDIYKSILLQPYGDK